MAITNAREYEAALEEAIALMDAEPGRQGAEPRLMQLLEDIERYRPTFSVEAPGRGDDISARAGELVGRATELKRRWHERQPSRWTSFPEGRDGIGPTTGV
ncbi:hypothetical protein ACFODL_11400 [Phenylobacterium terrae]|uniref:Uncharacterized protein n=1 Tax=Phenylobacterium terrae TaxID=2665495 RepID=A0ABW4MZI8_9CAUL